MYPSVSRHRRLISQRNFKAKDQRKREKCKCNSNILAAITTIYYNLHPNKQNIFLKLWRTAYSLSTLSLYSFKQENSDSNSNRANNINKDEVVLQTSSSKYNECVVNKEKFISWGYIVLLRDADSIRKKSPLLVPLYQLNMYKSGF